MVHLPTLKFTTLRREASWAMTPKRISSHFVGNATERFIQNEVCGCEGNATSSSLLRHAFGMVKPVSNATTSQIVSLEGAYVVDVTAGNAGFEINGTGTDLISTASVPTGGWTYIVGTSDSSGI